MPLLLERHEDAPAHPLFSEQHGIELPHEGLLALLGLPQPPLVQAVPQRAWALLLEQGYLLRVSLQQVRLIPNLLPEAIPLVHHECYVHAVDHGGCSATAHRSAHFPQLVHFRLQAHLVILKDPPLEACAGVTHVLEAFPRLSDHLVVLSSAVQHLPIERILQASPDSLKVVGVKLKILLGLPINNRQLRQPEGPLQVSVGGPDLLREHLEEEGEEKGYDSVGPRGKVKVYNGPFVQVSPHHRHVRKVTGQTHEEGADAKLRAHDECGTHRKDHEHVSAQTEEEQVVVSDHIRCDVHLLDHAEDFRT
mmetsp:Transcript_3967/g.9193  ORF Transcript_3967/g.9193 Transcript_3967/m.9193 type:complete len:307 (+) Transcript_3967:1786-2706(+)